MTNTEECQECESAGRNCLRHSLPGSPGRSVLDPPTLEAGSLHMRMSTDEALLFDFQSLIERDVNNGIDYPADDTEAFRAEILRRMKFGAR